MQDLLALKSLNSRSFRGASPTLSPHKGSALYLTGELGGPQTPRRISPPLTQKPGSAPEMLPRTRVIWWPVSSNDGASVLIGDVYNNHAQNDERKVRQFCSNDVLISEIWQFMHALPYSMWHFMNKVCDIWNFILTYIF